MQPSKSSSIQISFVSDQGAKKYWSWMTTASSTQPKSKVSSGKPKSGAPAYANRTAFRHNPSSKLTKKILAMPINGLCPACEEQIEWRKRFRKYKPLTVAKKW